MRDPRITNDVTLDVTLLVVREQLARPARRASTDAGRVQLVDGGPASSRAELLRDLRDHGWSDCSGEVASSSPSLRAAAARETECFQRGLVVARALVSSAYLHRQNLREDLHRMATTLPRMLRQRRGCYRRRADDALGPLLLVAPGPNGRCSSRWDPGLDVTFDISAKGY